MLVDVKLHMTPFRYHERLRRVVLSFLLSNHVITLIDGTCFFLALASVLLEFLYTQQIHTYLRGAIQKARINVNEDW